MCASTFRPCELVRLGSACWQASGHFMVTPND
jgi:hypothetical protein